VREERRSRYTYIWEINSLPTQDLKDDVSFLCDEMYDASMVEYTVPLTFTDIYSKHLKDPSIIKLQQETPHRLGQLFDNAGDKQSPHQVITICDPTTNHEHILIPQELIPRLLQ
jgi:hypothetical protein